MGWLLSIPMYIVVALFVMWMLYVLITLVMPMAREIKRKSPFMYYTFTSLAYAARWYDILLNVFLFSLLFWDIPREKTITGRMKRYLAGSGWRYKVADWVCKNMLEPIDCKHCGRGEE